MSQTKQEPWKKMLKKIEIFLAENQDQRYIFRGQSVRKEKIRSALHRHVYGESHNIQEELKIFESLPEPLEHKQRSLLQQMKDLFFPGEHELEILTQLQHLGEPTNFIDFTDDYHVALFFACSTPEKSNSNPVIYFYHADKGEFTDKNDVKLSKKMAEGNYIFRPSNPNNRIIAQRACFVHRKEGFLEIPSVFIPKSKKESFYVEIKREWRQHIIDYLQEKGITYRSLFNDLEGHIRYRSSYETLAKLKEKFLAIFGKGEITPNYSQAIELLEKIVEHDQVEAVVCASMFLADYIRKYKRQGINDFTEIRKEFDKLGKKLKPAVMFYFLRRYFHEFEEPKDEPKKWKKQLEDSDKIMEFQPDFYQVYFDQGILYSRQGTLCEKYDLKRAEEKFDLALQNYSKAIELKPDYHNIYLNRGHLYSKLGKFDLTLQDYNKALELKPDFYQAYNNRGVTYENQGKLDLALQDYGKAIELKPDYAVAYHARGLIYEKQDKLEEALKDYNKALEFKPNYHNAYLSRGALYERQDKLALALKDYNKVRDFNLLDFNGERVLRKIQERDNKDKKR